MTFVDVFAGLQLDQFKKYENTSTQDEDNVPRARLSLIHLRRLNRLGLVYEFIF